MVNLSAESGLGKTRVLQELYGWLAAQDAYWPPELRGPNLRKAIVPSREQWHGEPRLYWLGLQCFSINGQPALALDTCLRYQLRLHARALLARQQRTVAAQRAAIKVATSIGGVIGIDALRALIELLKGLSEAKDLADELLVAAGRESELADEDLVQATIDVADLISAQGSPLVLALDDAHDADASTLRLVERLLEGERAALVVTAGWPTAIAAQRHQGHGFGAWLQQSSAGHQIVQLELRPLLIPTLTAIAEAAISGHAVRRVDDKAAQLLVERAHGNALLLLHLLDLASAEGLSLIQSDRGQIALLPDDPEVVLGEVWSRFLPHEVRRLLEAAAVLDTPVHERMLVAAARSRAATAALGGQTVEDALRLGWLAAVADPYSDDRSLRFSEPLYAQTALRHANALIQSTRERLVLGAVKQALSLPQKASVYARTNAAQHAVRLLEEQIAQPECVLTITAFRQLASLVWVSDRRRAAELLEKAVRLDESHGDESSLELLLETSIAWCNLGEHDAALAVFDAALPRALAVKADQAVRMERYADAFVAAHEGLQAETRTAGAVTPTSEHDSATVCLAASLAMIHHGLAIADPPSASPDLRARAQALFWATAHALTRENRLTEAKEVALLASTWGIPGPRDGAWVGKLKPSEDQPSVTGDPDAQEAAVISNAMTLLAEDRFAEVADALADVYSRARMQQALPVLRGLLRRGGGDYAQRLGEKAMTAVAFATAAEAFRGALVHRLVQGVPLDHPDLHLNRFQLAEALACAGEGLEALTVAAMGLEIAERAKDPYGIAYSMLGLGFGHLACCEYDKAQAVLLGVRERLVHEGAMRERPGRFLRVALCELYGAQEDWQSIDELLTDMHWVMFRGELRHYWRLRGWGVLAEWRLQGATYERLVLEHADLQPELWALTAVRRALESLAGSMFDPAAGVSEAFIVDMREWLIETTEPAYAGEVAKIRQAPRVVA
jgi:tetratricopeptide (TPR) repeat protein